MADPLVVVFPGSAFKTQMHSLQRILSNSVKHGEVVSIAKIMQYVNLSEANSKLERGLIQRGNLTPVNSTLTNEHSSTLYERMYDTGDQLKEVYLQFPKVVKIKITEISSEDLMLDFTTGNKIIVIGKELPEMAGLSESFILETCRFHKDGTETILREEFGEGVIKIVVDFNKPMDAKLVFRNEGSSFRAKFFNTMAATFTDSDCCGGPVRRPVSGRAIIPIHIRIIQQPAIPVQQQVNFANAWLNNYNIEIQIMSTVNLNAPQFRVLDLMLPDGQHCIMGHSSDDQRDLYTNFRGTVPTNEIAIYYVEATTPAYWGCASHPAGLPSACVITSAGQYTLEHEIGHVLGLSHVNDNARLMTGNGMGNVTSPPPDLVQSELETIWRSQYIRIIN